ncbi:MAG: universal stress protein E [Paraglaciecola sp.]|jgi:universal stress protein E
MKISQKILVVISGKRKQHEALERALKFAEYTDVHIHIFNSIYEPVTALTDVLSSEHRKEMKRQYVADRYLYMDTIAAELDKKGIKCSVRVVWHRELQEAIEEAVIELEPDLVIKRISADAGSHNPFTMPVDRHLLRYCPAPLLLVLEAVWAKGPILAAVDPMTNDPAHIALNHDVLEYTKMLGHLTENAIHSVNTFETPAMSPAIDLPGIDYDLMRKDTAAMHQKKMALLMTEHAFEVDNIHLAEGSAEIAIAHTAKDIKAQIVVLGTVGRKGLAAALFGNTAERVLAKLSCEVLAIKPNIPSKKAEQGS